MALDRNPYPGLRPFEAEEQYLFFGREGQSSALVDALARHRFVAVVGSSGSGKSSLVRAGLIPALHGGFMPGAAGWRVAVMRPGNAPILRLAEALVASGALAGGPDDAHGPDRADDRGEAPAGEGLELRLTLAETALRRSSRALVELVERSGSGDNLLIVVDQFEEIFRFRREGGLADDDDALIKLVLAACAQTEVPIYVALTMRSDFLGDCALFRHLPEAINRSQYLIPRMTRDQMHAAIVGPAGVAGGAVAPRLVQRLLNDVGDDRDQLPILQHALMRTWERWSAMRRGGEPVDLEHYRAIGGLHRALSQHADEAYEELDEDGRRIAERVMKRLTEKEEEGRAVRSPATFDELCRCAGAEAPEAGAVLEHFRRQGRSFLMPPAGVELEPHTVVDISHESLIRLWRTLRRWAREEANSAAVYRRLVDAAVRWNDEYQRDEKTLWRGPELVTALDWQDRQQPNRAWARRYHHGIAAGLAAVEETQTVTLRLEDIAALRRAGGEDQDLEDPDQLLYAQAIEFLDKSRQAERTQQREAQLNEERRRQLEHNKRAARAFMLIVGLGVILGAIWLATLSKLKRDLEHAYGVKDAAVTFRVDLAEARMAEKRFVLRFREAGFQQAFDDFVSLQADDSWEHHLAAMEALGEKLRALRAARQTDDTGSPDRADADLLAMLATYRASFDGLLDLCQQRGFEKTGKIGELREAVHAIEERVQDDPELRLDLLELRRQEKDYLLRAMRDSGYADRVLQRIDEAREALRQRRGDPRLEGLAEVLARYRAAFDALVELDRRLLSARDRTNDDSERLEEGAERISAAADAAAAAAVSRGGTVLKTVALVGIAVAVAGLILAWSLLRTAAVAAARRES